MFGPISPPFAPTRMPDNTEPSILDTFRGLSPPEEQESIKLRTDTWARSIPFGRSPPHDSIDGENVRESPPAFSLPERGFQPASASPSPFVTKSRPMSLGTDNPSPSRHLLSDRQKRNSMTMQYQQYPPPPHLPQAHFFSAPDIEIPGIPSPARAAVQETGCSFCALDVLPSNKPRTFMRKVLVVGRDGGLEVLGLEGEKTRVLGALKGLNGRVLDVKILTWTSGVDPFVSSRPLVAVTIYGSVPQDEGGRCSSAVSENTDLLTGVSSRQDVYSNRAEVPLMQTRVQVYSLKTHMLVATLFATKSEPCYTTLPGTPPSMPPPAGELKLHASSNYLVIASGVSGEVFIFGASKNHSLGPFTCLGKAWTSVRMHESRRHSNSSSSTTTDDVQSDHGREAGSSETPVLSLSGRWLAVAPPPPNRTSLRGTIYCALNPKRLHEIDAHTPPSRPSVTCAVDCHEGSLFNKIARGVTQELWRGATWTGGQVAQTWNSYFNKETQPNPINTIRRPQPFDPSNANFLPPTHAQETQQPFAKEPDLISIIDLKRLENAEGSRSSATSPIATFQPPHGCSFISLSPNGLMLFTAGRKGDVQHVWDLMQMKHHRARPLIVDNTSRALTSNGLASHVREIAKFDRLTMTSILDVRWTVPAGERLAIVTKNGTIHLYDIPRGAFQWPPLRHALRQITSHGGSSPREENETGAVNRLSTAVKAIGGTTQPILAAFRGRAPSVGAAFAVGTGLGFASSRGGKIIASGLSKSVGAATETMNALRHFGETRLHLSNFAKDGAVSRLTWSGNEKHPLLGVIDGESFRVYKIRRGTTGKKNQEHSVFGARVREVRLPASLRTPLAPSQALLALVQGDITGFWSLPPPTRSYPKRRRRTSPLSHAEIETNAPYQPFHTDRRVSLLVYSSGSKTKSNETVAKATPWVFGNTIPMIKIRVNGHSRRANGKIPDDGEMENLISLGSGGANVEYAVITTRRRRRALLGVGADAPIGNEDGFFEDDCDILDFASDRV